MATINRYPSSLNLQYNVTNRKQLRLILLYVQHQRKMFVRRNHKSKTTVLSHVIELVTLVNGIVFLRGRTRISFDWRCVSTRKNEDYFRLDDIKERQFSAMLQ